MRYRQVSSSLNPSIIFGTREHIFILNIPHKVRGPHSFIEWEITISSDCSQGKGERLRCIWVTSLLSTSIYCGLGPCISRLPLTYEAGCLHAFTERDITKFSDFGQGEEERMGYRWVNSSLNHSILFFSIKPCIFILSITLKTRFLQLIYSMRNYKFLWFQWRGFYFHHPTLLHVCQ